VRVLVVDDQAVFAEAARELLEVRGHTVAEARDGREALDVAWGFRPEAALVDLMLDGESGLDVARALTRSYPGIAVLLMSASDAEPSLERLGACGARGFVPKRRLRDADLLALWRGGDDHHG
jgi:CheY-like chemotaxis protein